MPLVPLVPPSPPEQEFVQIAMGMRKHAAFSRTTLFSGKRSAWTASRRDDAGVAKPPEDLIWFNTLHTVKDIKAREYVFPPTISGIISI